MILQALTRYYEILNKDTESTIAPPGYCTANVSFALNLSSKGELLDIFPLFVQEQRGKKMVERPRRMIVPEQIKRSCGINPNFLCDNNAYVLGLSEKDSKNQDYGGKRFEAFRRFHKDILANADCDAARAVTGFLDWYDPLKGRKNDSINNNLEILLKGGNLVFMLDGMFAQDDPVIHDVWDAYIGGKDATIGQCLVSGEIAPIARLHASLKGVRDANPTGASLVGFNARAYESYNRTNGQGMNAPVSIKATFAYTTALNHLLSSANPNKKFYLGDTTVVYWAESEDKRYTAAFESIFDPGYINENAGELTQQKKDNELIRKIAPKVKHVQALDVEQLRKGLDERTRFYVLGLAPNAARIAVRFFHSDPFGKIIDRVMLHYKDMEIVKEFDNQPKFITVSQILAETIPKKAKEQKASPLLAGAIFRAILNNAPYPAALYYAILARIRADADETGSRKINYTRAAIIKAYLIRKYRFQSKYKEVFVMTLNEKSTNPAYALGRLFAVLEKVQQEAIGEMNASIKDHYFTTACAAPASVFPVLLKLSQHHITKAKYGHSSDQRIESILNLFDVENNPIPARLSLDDQGIFILGYYHQRNALYQSKTDKIATEDTLTE